MKTFLLTFLFMIGLTVVHGQEKMQFSILGGYEHFKNEAQNKTTGYGIGCEFKYYLLKTLYAVGNFHTGINSEFLPRTAIAEVGEVDFSMRWKTYEYKGGIGIGNDLYCKKAHKIYVQSTFGLSKTKQSVPQIEKGLPASRSKKATQGIRKTAPINERRPLKVNAPTWSAPTLCATKASPQIRAQKNSIRLPFN